MITFFTAGAVTLPLQIYSMIMNAVSARFMLLTLALIVIASRLSPGLLRVDQKNP